MQNNVVSALRREARDAPDSGIVEVFNYGRGRPGLIPVSALVTVVRRGFFRSWWRPARHRYVESPATRRVGVRAPAAA